MRANICGGEYTLSLPLGAIEEIARTQPRIEKLYRAIASGEWTLAELRVVIDAGLSWSGVHSLDFAKVVQEEGLAATKLLAANLLVDAFSSGSDRKKAEAAQTTDLSA